VENSPVKQNPAVVAAVDDNDHLVNDTDVTNWYDLVIGCHIPRL